MSEIRIYYAYDPDRENDQLQLCCEIFRTVLETLKSQNNKQEFSGIERFKESRDFISADFAAGGPLSLSELDLIPERPVPAILLLSGDEWDDDVNSVLQNPRYDVWGVFRMSKLLPECRDPEDFGSLTSIVKKLTRQILRGKGLHEEDFSKPIDWKARLKSEKDNSGFISLFSDPATKRMARAYKDAILDMQDISWRTFYKTKNQRHEFLKDYQQEFTSSLNFKKTHVPSLLLLGETGCGKSLLARSASKHLTPGEDISHINISAFTSSLIDVELFGAARGAYTDLDHDYPGVFIAHCGEVVFLDEIGDMDAACQTRLLTYMDNGCVQPRGMTEDIIAPCFLIAATNKDIDNPSSDFRQDIVHRFDHIIKIPPLRERKEDLPLLISLTLQNESINPLSRDQKKHRIGRISLDAIKFLESYNFPGNFRELEFILRQAVNSAFAEGSSCLCVRHIMLMR